MIAWMLDNSSRCKKEVSTDLSAPPEPFHAIPTKRHTAQLLKALCDVEVDQRRHFVKAHVVPLCIALSILLFHLRYFVFVVVYFRRQLFSPVC